MCPALVNAVNPLLSGSVKQGLKLQGSAKVNFSAVIVGLYIIRKPLVVIYYGNCCRQNFSKIEILKKKQFLNFFKILG